MHNQAKLNRNTVIISLLIFFFAAILPTMLYAASEKCSSVSQIYQNVDACDGQRVTLKGKIFKLKYQTSAKGNKYTTFTLDDNTAKPINVFCFSHLQGIADGATVQVIGTFKKISSGFPMQVDTTPRGVTPLAASAGPAVAKPERAAPQPTAPVKALQPTKESKQEPAEAPKPVTEALPQKETNQEAPQPVAETSTKTTPETPKKEDDGSTSTIIFIVIGLLVIGGGIFVVVMLGKKKPAKSSQPKPVVESAFDIEPEKQEEVAHDVGVAFEDYVLSRFDMRDWVVVDRTKDYSAQLGRKVESDSNPDLLMRHKDSGKTIAVECKFRTNFAHTNKGVKYITWASEFNIKNYNAYREKNRHRVFVVIGVGGLPSAPARLFVVPLPVLTKAKASEDYLNKFDRHPEYKFLIEEFQKLDKNL